MQVRKHWERDGDGAQSGTAAGFERLMGRRRGEDGALKGVRKAAMDRPQGGTAASPKLVRGNRAVASRRWDACAWTWRMTMRSTDEVN
ncbi:hypothetical protein FGB62_45g181 [Gracilaria domingensis]|nr:hypothetical protein FGB62_45g181 [Gracilaria domingensis]